MIDLAWEEGRELRDLLFGRGDPAEERFAVRLERGRAPRAVSTRHGVVEGLEAKAAPRAVRALAGEAARIVYIRAAPVASTLAGLASGAIQGDPARIAALAALRALPFGLASRAARALPAGVYALAIEAGPRGPGCLLCVRIRRGSIERLVGGSALGLGRGLPEREKWLGAVRLLGPLQLAVSAPRESVRAILNSARPASALERIRIREALRVERLSARVGALLLALRLFGR